MSVFCFQEGRKIWTKLHACVHVCFTLLEEEEGGGGGRGSGGFSRTCLHEALFPRLWKKSTGTFCNAKRVCMPNFIRFRATWKITTKWVHTPLFDGALQFYCVHHMRKIWGFVSKKIGKALLILLIVSFLFCTCHIFNISPLVSNF